MNINIADQLGNVFKNMKLIFLLKRWILDYNIFMNMWKFHIYPTSEKEVLDLSEFTRKLGITS